MQKDHISHTDSTAISLLRLPLALAIVFIHLNIHASGADINWQAFGLTDLFRLTVCVVTNQLASLAVPLFFIISGFLFFIGCSDREHYPTMWRFFKKRFARRGRSLLIPYVVFNLVALAGLVSHYTTMGKPLAEAVNLCMGGGKWLRAFWDIHTTGVTTNFLGISKPIAYPIDAPMWFVRDLMAVVVMSPLVYWAIRRIGWWWVAVLTALAMVGLWIPLAGFSVTSCLFFSIGACLSICAHNIGSTLEGWRKVIVPLAIIAMVGDIWADGTKADTYIHMVFLLSGTLTLLWMATTQMVSTCDNNGGMVWRYVITRGGEASFFVYATHALLIPFWGMRPVEWVMRLVWTNSTNGLVCIGQYLVAAVATFALCLVSCGILRRLCPKTLCFVMGR